MSLQRKHNLYSEAVLAKIVGEVEAQLQAAPGDFGIHGQLKKRFHRDGIREITNAFERLLADAFRQILPLAASNSDKSDIRIMLEKLGAHYKKVRASGVTGKSAVEREFFEHASRSLWNLYILRNWVAHESRQSSQDDYVECLRAFDIALKWYCAIFSDTQAVWLIPVDVKGVYLLDTETSRTIQIPRSVQRLKAEFERAYVGGDYAGLRKLVHPQFQGPEGTWYETKKTMIDTIRALHAHIGGPAGMYFTLDFKGFEVDDHGVLWWLVHFIYQKEDLARDEAILQARLSDLRSETARILWLKPFEKKA